MSPFPPKHHGRTRSRARAEAHDPIDLRRRTILIGGAAVTLSLAAGIGSARSQTATVEGVASFKVGSREGLAFLDGRVSLPAGAFSGAPDEDIRALIEGGEAVDAFVNAFVISGPDNVVLVDAGGGALLGPTGGNLAGRMDEAGIDPAMIDTVLVTHMHPDHIGGLIEEGTRLVPPEAQMVVHERELGFWSSDEMMQRVVAERGEEAANFFKAPRAAIAAFGERVVPIKGDGDVPGGMRSMELFGHTPGHTGFMIDDGGEQLLIWGDIVHAPAIQFARPEVTIAFDAVPEEASATRARVLDMAATDDLPVAGMHLAFPGIGRVSRDGTGYAFNPAG